MTPASLLYYPKKMGEASEARDRVRLLILFLFLILLAVLE